MNNTKNVAWGKVNFETYANDNTFISRPKSSLRQRTLSLRERLPPPKSPIKNPQKRTTSKIFPPNQKRSPSKKVKTVSTQTSLDVVATVTPTKMPSIVDLLIGSIAGIKRYDLDHGKFKQKKNAPMVHGIVENPTVYHGKDNLDKLKDVKLIVMFVVSREYK